MELRHYET